MAIVLDGMGSALACQNGVARRDLEFLAAVGHESLALLDDINFIFVHMIMGADTRAGRKDKLCAKPRTSLDLIGLEIMTDRDLACAAAHGFAFFNLLIDFFLEHFLNTFLGERLTPFATWRRTNPSPGGQGPVKKRQAGNEKRFNLPAGVCRSPRNVPRIYSLNKKFLKHQGFFLSRWELWFSWKKTW